MAVFSFEGINFNVDSEGFVAFADVANFIEQQAQYASRFLNPTNEVYFGDNIRFIGNVDDYHNIRIHRDDITIFVKKHCEYRSSAAGWRPWFGIPPPNAQ
jgi:hypothetical protein